MANLAMARKGLGRYQDAEELMWRAVCKGVGLQSVQCVVGDLEEWRDQSSGKIIIIM